MLLFRNHQNKIIRCLCLDFVVLSWVKEIFTMAKLILLSYTNWLTLEEKSFDRGFLPFVPTNLNKLIIYPKKRRLVPLEIKLYKIMSLTDLLPCYLISIVVLSLLSLGNFSLRWFYIVGVLMFERIYPFLLELNTCMMWLLENFFFILKNISKAIWLFYEWSYAIIGYSNQLDIFFKAMLMYNVWFGKL